MAVAGSSFFVPVCEAVPVSGPRRSVRDRQATPFLKEELCTLHVGSKLRLFGLLGLFDLLDAVSVICTLGASRLTAWFTIPFPEWFLQMQEFETPEEGLGVQFSDDISTEASPCMYLKQS